MIWFSTLKVFALVLSVCAFVLYLGRTRKFPRWDHYSLQVARGFLLATGALSMILLALRPGDLLLHLTASAAILTILSWYFLRHALLEILMSPLVFAYLLISMLSPNQELQVTWPHAILYLVMAASFHITLMGLILANLVKWIDAQDLRREPNWSPKSLAAHTRRSLHPRRLASGGK